RPSWSWPDEGPCGAIRLGRIGHAATRQHGLAPIVVAVELIGETGTVDVGPSVLRSEDLMHLVAAAEEALDGGHLQLSAPSPRPRPILIIYATYTQKRIA